MEQRKIKIIHHFKPNQILSGSDWNAGMSKKHQELLDQHNLHNNTNNKEKYNQLHLNHNINSVKIIDKSYFQMEVLAKV